MDGIEVSPIDRAKYRFLLWLREKLYERPAGYMLRDGVVPPSIQKINAFFAGKPMGIFLPYEVYTEEGLFLQDDSMGLAMELTVFHRLRLDVGAELQQELLQLLPDGYFCQVQLANLGSTNRYRVLLTVTGHKDTADRKMLVALREQIADLCLGFGITASNLQPESLLSLITALFDDEYRHCAPAYDDTSLIKNQAGHAHVSIRDSRIVLSEDGHVFREILVSQSRRFGLTEILPLQGLYPVLLHAGKSFLSFNFRKSGTAVEGQFAVFELVTPGGASNLPGIFSRHDWLLEHDRFNTHLTLLSSLPLGISPGLYPYLKEARRWRPFTMVQAGALMPLTYMPNDIEAMATNTVTTRAVGEVAHA